MAGTGLVCPHAAEAPRAARIALAFAATIALFGWVASCSSSRIKRPPAPATERTSIPSRSAEVVDADETIASVADSGGVHLRRVVSEATVHVGGPETEFEAAYFTFRLPRDSPCIQRAILSL